MLARERILLGAAGNLAALDWGDDNAPPLLALHGWLDNAASFMPLARELSGCRLVALDFPGHGKSEHRPPGAKYHLVDYVGDVAAAVASLGWREFSLLGHSLGAGVALLYAATFPQQVKKLVLLDGLGPITNDDGNVAEQLARSLAGSPVGASPPRGYSSWDALIEKRGKAGPLSLASAEMLVRRAAVEKEDGIFLNVDRRLKQPSALYLHEQQVLGFLRAVAAPTMLFKASKGVLSDSAKLKGRIAAVASLTVAEVDGGHHLHMEAPKSIASDLQTFLAHHS